MGKCIFWRALTETQINLHISKICCLCCPHEQMLHEHEYANGDSDHPTKSSLDAHVQRYVFFHVATYLLKGTFVWFLLQLFFLYESGNISCDKFAFAHLHRVIRDFAFRLTTLWILGYSENNLQIPWSDCIKSPYFIIVLVFPWNYSSIMEIQLYLSRRPANYIAVIWSASMKPRLWFHSFMCSFESQSNLYRFDFNSLHLV